MPERTRSLQIDPPVPLAWARAMMVLSVVSLGVVLVDAALDDAERMELLGRVDLAICSVFLADFAWRLAKSPRRVAFVRDNWLDLVGAIPMVDALRAARVVRLVRVLRVARLGGIVVRALRQRGLVAPTTALSHLALVTFFLWLSAGTAFFFAEHGKNESIAGFDDALWWSMTTLSTVGYGDLFPRTPLGRLIGGATMITGVGVLGALAAMIASALIDLRERARKGLRSFKMKDHLLVLGWNSKARLAIEEFLGDARHSDRQKVCIVADVDQIPMDAEDVVFVRGDRTSRATLERASAAHAALAIVFASDPSDPRSDHAAVLTILALRRLNTTARISAELVEASNHEHLVAVGCDSVVDGAAISSALLVRAVRDAGVQEVVLDLISTAHGWELYRMKIGADFVGRTYRELATSLLDRGSSVIGLARDGQRLLTPDASTVLRGGDEAFVVSNDPPS